MLRQSCHCATRLLRRCFSDIRHGSIHFFAALIISPFARRYITLPCYAAYAMPSPLLRYAIRCFSDTMLFRYAELMLFSPALRYTLLRRHMLR